MFRISTSFNENFISNYLTVDKNVSLIEMGIRAYYHIRNSNFVETNYKGLFSLHIARSPITESYKNQLIFYKEKLKYIKNDNRMVSIGFHLTGNRGENIGKYGFSSHYFANKNKENNAINFINLIRKELNKEVWIENANFYSNGISNIIKNWESFNRIITKSESKIIIRY